MTLNLCVSIAKEMGCTSSKCDHKLGLMQQINVCSLLNTQHTNA